MRVQIDGIDYKPADNAKPAVGIAITTHNRPDALAECLTRIKEFTPPDFPIVVVDDASTPAVSVPHGVKLIRTETNVGIPRAKNLCIEALMHTGAQHLFLLDDDCWPARNGWWMPYVDGPEPHYNYIFTTWANGQPVGDCNTVYNDGVSVAFTHPRGCAMYLHREVVERVGGFDTAFGLGMNEHLEYSQRICNAGLTSFPYMDVVSGDDEWYSMDRAQCVRRTLDASTRATLLVANDELLARRQGFAGYREYRETTNVVVTSLLTGNPDPQRGTQLPADPELAKAWRDSIISAEPYILTDQIDTNAGNETVKVPAGWSNPYFQRWMSAWQFLRRFGPIENVWITDATDVTMVNEPWPHMRSGVLYVGSEHSTLDNEWMHDNHEPYREWLQDNKCYQLLNCGVVGGDYATVMEFLGDMIRELVRAYGKTSLDMGPFNYVVRQPKWHGRIEFGPHVTSQFKGYEKGTKAWWRHK